MDKFLMSKFFDRIFSIFQYCVLLFVSFIAAIPLYSCFLSSLKSNEELVSNPFLKQPDNFLYLENYNIIIKSGYFYSLITTTIIIIVSVCISSLLNAMMSYAMCRLQFKGKKIIYALIIVSSFIPNMTMQIYIFRIMVNLNLVNTLTGYIMIISSIDIISIIIFNQYFSSFPESIDEAAYLDGCSSVKIFFKIHIPLLKQAFLTVAIIRGIYVYNEYYIANIYLLDKSKYQTVTTV